MRGLEYEYMAGSGAPPPIALSRSELLDAWAEAWSDSRDGRDESDTVLVMEGEEEETATARDVEAEEDDNPRPKKDPKGERWRGRPKSSSGALPRNAWWRNSKNCFEVDQICHRRKGNEWFYYPTPQQYEYNEDGQDDYNALFQPNMELKSAPAKYDGGKNTGDKRISIKVSSSSKFEAVELTFEEDDLAFVKTDSNDDRCQVSPSKVHVVLQSVFNDMIGEFYSRTLLGLYLLMKKGVDANGNDGGKLPWEEVIQFYVHIPYGNKNVLDGHKLLLSGMLSNPDSPSPKSFLDLFVREEGKHDDDDCQCYEKMVFCGYDVYTHENNVLSKDLEPAVDSDFSEDIVEEDLLISVEDNAPVSLSSTKYTLWSTTSVGKAGHDGCGRSSPDGEEYACLEWKELRLHLGANLLTHYPTLKGDVVEKRRDYLLEKGVIDKGYRGNTNEFTVIGLTQRTYRRAWSNLPDILEECNAAAFERVICVEVNVEKTSSPSEQLILHRSLDVMIGVHGAQLTQAVLLPPHAHVLELLPWITDYIQSQCEPLNLDIIFIFTKSKLGYCFISGGGWVATTHVPTPLGVIFHNTDLNHLGYSLDRSSVPLCEGVPKDQEKQCFMSQKKKFIWENRDFTVESSAILRYIDKFVLFVREKDRTCDELKDTLDKKFVMYNIWCVKPNYWFRGTSEGEDDCIHGSGYSIDHTDSSNKDLFLFDKREDCCNRFYPLCQTKIQNIQHSSENTTLSLWHNYQPLTKASKIDKKQQDAEQ
ncbi:LOW QUALITY PROTEIN: hypothetical protein ACHAW5_001171 [Stephanodiscus triporus]|uniref:Uncharacterized protein n=1 Tax=Stephanodiscus triporus TaxID=2934178 RepID=A0ABD3MSR9_9STRA